VNTKIFVSFWIFSQACWWRFSSSGLRTYVDC